MSFFVLGCLLTSFERKLSFFALIDLITLDKSNLNLMFCFFDYCFTNGGIFLHFQVRS